MASTRGNDVPATYRVLYINVFVYSGIFDMERLVIGIRDGILHVYQEHIARVGGHRLNVQSSAGIHCHYGSGEHSGVP